jgi:hypothetical protein
MTSIELDIIGNWEYRGDAREPYGACRWCGQDNADRQGLALIRQGGAEWYECGCCALAVIALALDVSDPDEIRRRSALIRADRVDGAA